MVFRALLAVCLVGSLTASRPAHAQQEASEADWNGPTVFVSWAPMHLVFPIVEITAEFRVATRISVAAIAGAGSVIVEGGDRYGSWAAGGQFRYYALGDFRHGMQLGAEMLYLHVGGEVANLQAGFAGLSMGPFVGYKYTMPVGFTVNVQGGVQVVVVPRRNSMGETHDDSMVDVLLNIDFGWSF